MNKDTAQSVIQLIKFNHGEGRDDKLNETMENQWSTLIERIEKESEPFVSGSHRLFTAKASDKLTLVYVESKLVGHNYKAVVSLNDNQMASHVLYFSKA